MLGLLTISASSHGRPVSGFELGMVGGRDTGAGPLAIHRLGARIARIEFSIDSSPEQLAPVIGAYAERGVRVLPLAGFIGRVPSAAEAAHLASWAAAFGSSGSFWRHRRERALAVREIEFGNETSYGDQFGGCGPSCRGYARRAGAYARAFTTAARAIAGPRGNTHVGLLAQADYGGQGDEWVRGMFKAAPQLARRVAGWTVHAYGPRARWQPRLDALIHQTAAMGARAGIPIYVTELGLASDDGRCLSENYGWNPCMSYAQAGRTLRSTVAAIRARYGMRIRSILIYSLADLAPPGENSDRENYFGVLRADGGAKGAYTTAVRTLLHAHP